MPNPAVESPFETYERRREFAKTLVGFSLIYLSGYFTEAPATFHAEMLRSLEDDRIRRLEIIGFRGSGKSIFGSLALPLWAALEQPKKFPFIILVGDSSRQASLNIASIKHELETNDLINGSEGTTRLSQGYGHGSPILAGGRCAVKVLSCVLARSTAARRFSGRSITTRRW